MSLIIFIKNPALGKVKTRLAATLGDEVALDIYHKLSARTREVASAIDFPRFLYYSDFIDRTDDWDNALFVKRLQEGEDLGERMLNAFIETLQVSSPAIIIGSDCPLLTPGILHEAFNELKQHPFVLGPALDGGYYLLGMHEPCPELFQAMEWSTDTVAQVTLERITERNQACALLPPLPDVDEAADWERYGW
jgi:rSAM/selenodomain-associated transferase 1